MERFELPTPIVLEFVFWSPFKSSTSLINSLASLIPLIEVKIFPFNYVFKNEFDNQSGVGIICRGSAKISNNQDENRSEVLSKGDVISAESIQRGDKLVSETPITVMWVESTDLKKVRTLLSNRIKL